MRKTEVECTLNEAKFLKAKQERDKAKDACEIWQWQFKKCRENAHKHADAIKCYSDLMQSLNNNATHEIIKSQLEAFLMSVTSRPKPIPELLFAALAQNNKTPAQAPQPRKVVINGL